jgi:hypothetical protein
VREYIFLTTEGYTYDSNHKEISNMQILGSAEGSDVLEAFKIFKQTHSYIKEYAFTEVIALQTMGKFIRNLEL